MIIDFLLRWHNYHFFVDLVCFVSLLLLLNVVVAFVSTDVVVDVVLVVRFYVVCVVVDTL